MKSSCIAQIVLLFLGLLPALTMAQENKALKRELDSMYVLDQRNREWLTKLGNNQPLTDSLSKRYKTDRKQLGGALWAEQEKIDSSNLARAEAILKQYGYPGKSLVGAPTNETVFFIIQHSKKIPTYIPIIKKAADSQELRVSLYAMMLDRSLIYAGKPQQYGSQVMCQQLVTSKQTQCFVWPIADAKNVNARRKQAGIPLSVEENATRLNAAYDPSLTIQTVRKTYVIK